MYDGGTAHHPAAVSRGRSYWAHRFSGSEIENKNCTQNHRAGQVQAVLTPLLELGVQGSTEMPLRPGKPGARSWPVYDAAQEVAPPRVDARPRGRSARTGSFWTCRVVTVAAPVWVQAWVGAVGRVRNDLFPTSKKKRRTTLENRFASLFPRVGQRGAFGLFGLELRHAGKCERLPGRRGLLAVG